MTGGCRTAELPAPGADRGEDPVIVVPAPDRRRRRSATGFWIATLTILLIGGQTATPSPVYPLYAQMWHLSAFTTTVMFAAYALGMVCTLLTAGSVADHIGRRPVVVIAATVAIGSLVLFAVATGPLEVVFARLLQGVALALDLTALGAILLDLAPSRRPQLAATLNGAMPPAGLAFSALTSSVLVQYAPMPTITVYIVNAAATALMTALLFLAPERHARRPGLLASLRPSIGIPRQARPAFVTVLGCLLASWALGGLYLSLGPSVVRSLFGLHNALSGGAAIAAVTGTGALTGLLLQRRTPSQTMTIGAVALVVGPILTIGAVLAPAAWLFYVSSVVGGVGFGAGFQGGLRLILASAPGDRRSGLLSSIYLVSYSAVAVPALIASLLVPHLGLTAVMIGYAVLVALSSSTALLAQRLNAGTGGVHNRKQVAAQ
ncbi:MFS transporter [Actinoallomurus sp. NPDC052308]|uniref:MFS transporter n=1 Tax=Actinoallomurus sp. NPDC052308 TaxID=3155530 RepID=UPI00342BB7F3